MFRLYGAVHTYEEHTSADVQFYDVGYKRKKKKRKRKKKKKEKTSHWLKARTATYPRAEHFNDFLHTSSGSGRLGILR